MSEGGESGGIRMPIGKAWNWGESVLQMGENILKNQFDLIQTERFHAIVHSAKLAGLISSARFLKTAHHDHLLIGKLTADLPQDHQPADSRHHHVAENKIRMMIPYQRKGRMAVRRLKHGKSKVLKKIAKDAANMRIVIDQKNLVGVIFHHDRSLLAGGVAALQ